MIEWKVMTDKVVKVDIDRWPYKQYELQEIGTVKAETAEQALEHAKKKFKQVPHPIIHNPYVNL